MNINGFSIGIRAAIFVALHFFSIGCEAADTSPISNKEKEPMTTPPSISRPPAPEVSPIEFGGIRYQQDSTDERQGDQKGGYLVAIDSKTGERLWRLKVYDVPDSRAAGIEMGGIYFRSMSFAEDNKALDIENEVGSVYRVDLETQSVQKLSGPPDEVEAKPGKPKPTPE